MKPLRVAALVWLLANAGGAASIPCTGTTSLRHEAEKKDILIGSGAINPDYLEDFKFAAVLARQFNSLSPENELKWNFIHPTEDYWNWDLIDRLVAFAEKSGMVVKGHGFLSRCCNPEYLLNITEPAMFRSKIKDHIEAIMHRYKGKVDRWDVVSEALYTQGGGLEDNDLYKVLGPSYIEDAFKIAREADPDAKLFFNENLVETIPQKRAELYDIISDYVAKGVPIDGVALQMHITEVAPVSGVLTDMVKSYNALGLEVAIAELDVHTLNTTLQTQIYGDIVKEALEAGITDISFWGFTDKHLYTWLPGAKPLMFNEYYAPKGAFFSTHDALADFVIQK